MSSPPTSVESDRVPPLPQLVGIVVAKSTVEKYMVRRPTPPSPTWRAFLKNHVKEIVAIDFFVVPTVRNQVLYVFLVLAHDRRRVLHFNVTCNPTAERTAQQIVEAFPWERSAKYLLRDRDKIYGGVGRPGFPNRVSFVQCSRNLRRRHAMTVLG
jgi:hypothetical protein